MNHDRPFLTYNFQGFKFEFIQDFVRVTNERYHPYRSYVIRLQDYSEAMPFVIIAE